MVFINILYFNFNQRNYFVGLELGLELIDFHTFHMDWTLQAHFQLVHQMKTFRIAFWVLAKSAILPKEDSAGIHWHS
jgi:hypothetical protein